MTEKQELSIRESAKAVNKSIATIKKLILDKKIKTSKVKGKHGFEHRIKLNELLGYYGLSSVEPSFTENKQSKTDNNTSNNNLHTQLLEEKDKQIETLKEQLHFYQNQQNKMMERISDFMENQAKLIENQQTLSNQVNQLANQALLKQGNSQQKVKKSFLSRFFGSSSEEKS